MPSLFLRLHPDDVVAATALILAAAGAVRSPTGGVVAGWDFTHRLNPLFPVEAASEATLDSVANTLGCSCASFVFTAAPKPWQPGLVPPLLPALDEPPRILFEPAIAALAAKVQTEGALGLLVTNGERSSYDPDATASFRPGILRINPCESGEDLSIEDDPFTTTDYPTLVLSDRVDPGRLSAHELLETSQRLAARMAEDLRTHRRG